MPQFDIIAYQRGVILLAIGCEPDKLRNYATALKWNMPQPDCLGTQSLEMVAQIGLVILNIGYT